MRPEVTQPTDGRTSGSGGERKAERRERGRGLQQSIEIAALQLDYEMLATDWVNYMFIGWLHQDHFYNTAHRNHPT